MSAIPKPIILNAAPSARALTTKPSSLNEEARTIDVVFASEKPCRAWMPEIGEYEEILDCTEQSCDMFRLKNGAQFLKEHNRSLVVGVVDDARFEISPQGEKIGIATLRFAKNSLGEEEFLLAKDGIRGNYSVSYQVSELTLERASKEDGDIYRATKWEALEISVVSVEADTNCKLLRSRAEGTSPVQIQLTDSQMKKSIFAKFFLEPDNGSNPPAPAAPTPPAFDADAERKRMRAELLKTHKEIAEGVEAFKRAGKDVSAIGQRAINEDWTVDKFRMEAIAELNKETQRAVVTPSHVEVIGERKVKTIGELFVGDQGMRNFSKGAGKRSSAIVIPDYTNFRATGLTSTITSYSGITQAPGPITLGVQEAHVADLMSQGVTGLSSVPYLLEDTLTPAATSVAQEGLKPEASWDWSQASAPVVKIAVVGRVTDELFEDVPGMQSYIDSRLRYMVEIEEDDQLLNGNGGGDLTGIINTSGVNTQALGALTKSDAIRKGMTKVQSTGFFQPDGIVCHPNDWEELSLLKDSNGQYLAGGPFYAPYGAGQYVSFQRIWGLPVVVTTSCPENTVIVGAWKLGAMIFRKKGLTLETTNSDGEDFRYNRIAIRAEERLALAVWRPKAFTLVTGM